MARRPPGYTPLCPLFPVPALFPSQLAWRLLGPCEAGGLDPRDEGALGVALERRDAEAGFLRQEVRRRAVQVGEVAASAPGDADLLRRLGGLFQQQHGAPAPAGLDRRHKAGGPSAENDDIEAVQEQDPCTCGGSHEVTGLSGSFAGEGKAGMPALTPPDRAPR